MYLIFLCSGFGPAGLSSFEEEAASVPSRDNQPIREVQGYLKTNDGGITIGIRSR